MGAGWPGRGVRATYSFHAFSGISTLDRRLGAILPLHNRQWLEPLAEFRAKMWDAPSTREFPAEAEEAKRKCARGHGFRGDRGLARPPRVSCWRGSDVVPPERTPHRNSSSRKAVNGPMRHNGVLGRMQPFLSVEVSTERDRFGLVGGIGIRGEQERPPDLALSASSAAPDKGAADDTGTESHSSQGGPLGADHAASGRQSRCDKMLRDQRQLLAVQRSL